MGFFRILWAAILAIPFYYLWHYLAPIYAAQLPATYLNIPLLDTMGVFVLIQIAKMILFSSHGHHAWHWKAHRAFHKCGNFWRHGIHTEKYRHE